MALSEEEKQRIIEEEKLRAKIRKETRGIGCGTIIGWGIIILILLGIIGNCMEQYRKTTRSIKAPNKYTSIKDCEIIDVWIGGTMPPIKGPVYSILVNEDITKEKLKDILHRLFNEKREERGDYTAVHIAAFISKEDYEDGHWVGSLFWSELDKADAQRIEFNKYYWGDDKDYWSGRDKKIGLGKSGSLTQQIKSYFLDPKIGYNVVSEVIVVDNTCNITIDLTSEELLKYKGENDPEARCMLNTIIVLYIYPVGYRCLHMFPEIKQINITVNIDKLKAYAVEIPRDVAYSVDMRNWRDKSKKNIDNLIESARVQYLIKKFKHEIFNEKLKKATLPIEENISYAARRCTSGKIINVGIKNGKVLIDFIEYDYGSVKETVSQAKVSIISIIYVLLEEFPSIQDLEVSCTKPQLKVVTTRNQAELIRGGVPISILNWEVIYDKIKENK